MSIGPAVHTDGACADAAPRLGLGLGDAGEEHTPVGTRDGAVVAAADVAFAGQGGAALFRPQFG